MPKVQKSSKETKVESKPEPKSAKGKGEENSKKVTAEKPVKDTANKAAKQKDPEKSKDDDKQVLYSAECSKLTSRGKGKLLYEIGVDDSQEPFIRIVSCGSSGAFSKAWVKIEDIKKIIDDVEEDGFRSIVLHDLFKSRSANNHGFLGAVLKHLEVFSTEPEQPTVLYLEGWESLMTKIESLKKDQKTKS